MCNFLSLLSDGQGNIYYFDQAARRAKIADKMGMQYRYDSHASIADYYGLDEDVCNKWEYNPYTDALELDMRNAPHDDRTAVLKAINKIDLSDLCGNYKAVRALLAEIKGVTWLDNHGPIPTGVEMYDTQRAALDAARKAALDAAFGAARKATLDATLGAASDAALDAAFGAVCKATLDATLGAASDAAFDAARKAALDAAFDAARKAAFDVALGAARKAALGVARKAAFDAALLAHLLVVDDIIDPVHLDYARQRWAVWQAGYGVFRDVGGVIYGYRKR